MKLWIYFDHKNQPTFAQLVAPLAQPGEVWREYEATEIKPYPDPNTTMPVWSTDPWFVGSRVQANVSKNKATILNVRRSTDARRILIQVEWDESGLNQYLHAQHTWHDAQEYFTIINEPKPPRWFATVIYPTPHGGQSKGTSSAIYRG